MRQATLKIHTSPVRDAHRKARRLGLAAALVSRLFQTPLPGATSADLAKHDCSTSTQRMGIRFTERIRNAFRRRWIREIF
jgi:hypothetical protein